MKPRVLYINSVCGFGSTGKLVTELCKNDKYDSLVCYGRNKKLANVNSFQFANFFDNAVGALSTILFDNNLNICTKATRRLIKKIKEYNPDIIHLHNLHGYYVNVEMLFKFLKDYGRPIVWTLHDCWSFTGYCPYFDSINCDKYKKECKKCKYAFAYPFSIFKQNVTNDFYKKKELFNSLGNLTLTVPSMWMREMVNNSFLNKQKCEVIYNGIDLTKFTVAENKKDKFTCIAVANYWTEQKGLNEINKLVPLLDKDINFIVVGNGSDKTNATITVNHTDDTEELAKLYGSSHLFVNVTLQEAFGLVNAESLACGTPVITYNTGGSPEIINEKTGVVVDKGDYQKMAKFINDYKNNQIFKSEDCVNRSKDFSIEKMKGEFYKLYESLLAD